jgi:hypothetical protein
MQLRINKSLLNKRECPTFKKNILKYDQLLRNIINKQGITYPPLAKHFNTIVMQYY